MSFDDLDDEALQSLLESFGGRLEKSRFQVMAIIEILNEYKGYENHNQEMVHKIMVEQRKRKEHEHR